MARNKEMIMDPSDFCDLAYELYKIKWMHNNVTEDDERKAALEYYTDTEPEYRKECSLHDSIWENGYSGSLYVCYDEFMQEEFLDEEFMSYLLDGTGLEESYLKAKKEFLGE